MQLMTPVLILSDFTNAIKQTDIKGLAEADDHETVKELQVCLLLMCWL